MNRSPLMPFRERTNGSRSDATVFGSLQREVDRLFEDFARGAGLLDPRSAVALVPSIDIVETDKDIQLTAELPGLERKDVEVSLDGDVLTIRGEKKFEADDTDKDKNKNVHMAERRYGVFYRVLQMPAGIDPSTVRATMSNGVLKITIPKPARTDSRKIEIKEAA